MSELTNDVLGRAGITGEIANQTARRKALVEQSDEQGQLQQKQFGVIERMTEDKAKALDPLREQYIAKAKGVPSFEANEEPLPKYERPTMDPKDLQESFGILMTTAMIFGAASRQPFYVAANALTGAINGFMQQDDKIVKQSMAEFDRNLQVVKENNAQKRREVDEAFKKYANDLQALQSEMQIIAAKYDDPIALATARAKSISEAKKLIDGNISKVDASIVRLEQSAQRAYETAARMEEARARREEAAGQRQFMNDMRQRQFDLSREREDRLRGEADRRSGTTRFKDVQSLRKEYQKESKGLREDLGKIDRIISLAERSGGFPDIQLRQAISDFQRGARATNAMIESMKNFGSLDERIAGSFSRFFDGDYTLEQRDAILDLFRSMKKDVVEPGIRETKAQYRLLAERNRLPADEVVVEVGALAPDDAAPSAPTSVQPEGSWSAPGASPPMRLKITPR